MASTITPATLTLSISESVTLNGKQQGGTTTHTISSINEVFKRIVTCPASVNSRLLLFAAAVNTVPAAFDVDDAKYVRITNLDDTNAVTVSIAGSATLYQVNLAAGESYVLGAPKSYLLAEEDLNPSFGTLEDVGQITVNPGSNAVDLELFVASA